jgi:hypothetical protein
MKPGMTMRPEASITAASFRMQVRPDGKDLLALDQHVGPREVADLPNRRG